jgi:hypothetical protein
MVLKRSLTLLVVSTLAALAAASIVTLLGLSAQQARAQDFTEAVSVPGAVQEAGASANKIVKGKNTTLRFTVRLNGDAQRIQERLTFPSSFNLRSADPNQGDCSISGRQVYCDYGRVQSGATVYVDVRFTPTKAGTFNIPALICGGKDGCIAPTYRIVVDKDRHHNRH